MPIQSYKELDVWKRSIQLVKHVYQIAGHYPASERFSVSITTGRGFDSGKYCGGLGARHTQGVCAVSQIARGSLLELETHLVVAKELGYLSEAPFKALESVTTTIAKMLHRLIARLTTG